MLKEPTDELRGLQAHGARLIRAALSVTHRNVGGFMLQNIALRESDAVDVASQVGQRLLAASYRLGMHDPLLLLPHLVLDGSKDADRRLKMMLHWDVNNGIARRSWARNDGAMFAIKREMERTPDLKVTVPNIADDAMIDKLF